jgi:hypothetical protein
VHPGSRQLRVNRERFEAEWRRARWYDVLWLNWMTVVGILLPALAAAVTAVIAFPETAKKVSWGVAGLALVFGIGALAVKVRQKLNSLKP